MCASQQKPSVTAGILKMRCPECRSGRVFVNRNVFPLGDCLKMNSICPECGAKLIGEANNGPGINYALTVMVFFLNLCWYWPIFGISYLDNSIYYYLVSSTLVVILLQPWLMRISRIFYLYIIEAVKEQ